MNIRLFIVLFYIPSFLLAQHLSEEDLKPKENSTIWESILYEKVPADLNISSSLYQIARYHQENPEDAIRKVREETTILIDIHDRINIEFFHNDENYKMKADEINELTNYNNSQVWNNWAESHIDISQIFSIGHNLPEGFNMIPVLQPNDDNEGPGLQNDSAYIANGANGAGIRIAIFDSGFTGLNTRITNGVAPNAVYYWDNGAASTLTNVVAASTTVHGTGCIETVFDNAPGAIYEVYMRNSVTDYGNAVNQAIANGVNIISNSQSNYNRGWADNSGAVCAAVQNASDNGILWFASSGNRAQSHWEGNFSDADGDNWHNFSGGDEINDVTIRSGSNFNSYLSWNDAGTGSTANYDFYLYDIGTSPITLLASSTGSSGFEQISYTNSTGSNINAGFAVISVSGTTPVFEFFRHASDAFEYQTASGSNSSPSNSTAANVISVGAVHLNNYNSTVGTSAIIEPYSSQGPTNSGNLCPDICAPTNTSTQSYGFQGFAGTSCSTPNAAGAAAAFWSAHPNLSATGVSDILLRKADLYKDWGSNGADNIYGWGGVYLYDYFVNTTYLYRGSNNTSGTATLPYYYVSDAESATNTNGRVIMLGGNYLENVILGDFNFINKSILYKSLIKNSHLGY